MQYNFTAPSIHYSYPLRNSYIHIYHQSRLFSYLFISPTYTQVKLDFPNDSDIIAVQCNRTVMEGGGKGDKKKEKNFAIIEITNKHDIQHIYVNKFYIVYKIKIFFKFKRILILLSLDTNFFNLDFYRFFLDTLD